MAAPTSLLEAVTYFADLDRAHAYFDTVRWPNGAACPRMGCGSADVRAVPTRRRYRCRECKRDFTSKVGTIFEDSPLGLDKWLPAVWLLTNAKNGISSCELARALKVTQKTAWFMLHRIRVAYGLTDAEPLSGEVEADETFIGGRKRTTWTSRAGFKKMEHGPSTGKATVFGMVERRRADKPGHAHNRVRAMVVPDRSRASLMPKIREHVLPGSVLYTDAWGPYKSTREEYVHFIIDHAVAYVEGRVHTNTIENFWSCVKRTLHGTYIAPRAFHLDAYLDEQVWRFNERDDNDGGRFAKAAKAVDGKRLTYKTLIARNTSKG